MRLTLKELELLDTTSAYNGAQHGEICGKAALELIEYKKIEEELGIDLITLLKALKNGVYVKEVSGKIKYYNPDQIAVNWVGYYLEIVFLNTAKKGDYCALNTNAYKLPYTPTWALTKEELL